MKTFSVTGYSLHYNKFSCFQYFICTNKIFLKATTTGSFMLSVKIGLCEFFYLVICFHECTVPTPVSPITTDNTAIIIHEFWQIFSEQ